MPISSTQKVDIWSPNASPKPWSKAMSPPSYPQSPPPGEKMHVGRYHRTEERTTNIRGKKAITNGEGGLALDVFHTMPPFDELMEGLRVSKIVNEEHQFSVDLKINFFDPESLSVEVIDNRLVISGRYEEMKSPEAVMSREFQRVYVIPEGIEHEKVTSKYVNGVLTVVVPKQLPERKNVIIPIVARP